MMRKLEKLLLAAAVAAMTVSCNKEEESTGTPNAAITSFTLGYFYVDVHDLTYERKDTVIRERQGGAMYPMTIDQLSGKICNLDSIDYGADLSSVLVTIKSVGTVLYQYLDEDTAVYYSYSSSDSLDLTRPLKFTAVSTDATYFHEYMLSLNVRKMFPDSLLWSQETQVAKLEGIKSALAGDSLFILGSDAGTLGVQICNLSDRTWSQVLPVTGLPSNPVSLTVQNDSLIALCGTQLFASANGKEWKLRYDGINTLYSGSPLWAVGTDDSLKATADFDYWYVPEKKPLDFPLSGTCISDLLPTNNNIGRMVMVGQSRETEEYASVWYMLTTDSCWTRADVTAQSTSRLPNMKNLKVFSYDGSLFALGGDHSMFYQSMDHGLTWFACDSYVEEWNTWNRYMQLPDGLKGYKGNVTADVDIKGRIWLVSEDGRCWNGGITRLLGTWNIAETGLLHWRPLN